jgi:hypothetical protein
MFPDTLSDLIQITEQLQGSFLRLVRVQSKLNPFSPSVLEVGDKFVDVQRPRIEIQLGLVADVMGRIFEFHRYRRWNSQFAHS